MLKIIFNIGRAVSFFVAGWGEFPVRVQLHLNDSKGRKVDIIHNLKLDRSYTGLQNLGAETHVDIVDFEQRNHQTEVCYLIW